MIKDSFWQKELQSSINKYSNENQATTEDKVNRAKNSLQSDKITQSNIRDSINTTSKGKTLLSEEEISSILKKRQIAQKYLIETGDYDIFSLPPQDLTEQLR
jgi:fructose-1,6-bisphosphatase/inositol monophosphatase family enzyme